MMNMRVGTVVATLALAGSLLAGTCVRDFRNYRGWALADLQVPVTLVEGVDGFTHADAAAGGADLCVSDGTTASLPREIESWNVNGRSVVWVKVPSFSKDTVLTFSWGADAAAAADTSNIWPDALALFHGSAAKDSSASGVSVANFTAGEDGPVGMAMSMNGTTAQRPYGAPFTKEVMNPATNTFTISFWLRLDNLTQLQKYVVYNNHSAGQVAVIYGYNGSKLELFSSNSLLSGSADPRNISGIPVPDTNWHHYAWVYNGKALRCYRDAGLVSNYEVKFCYKPWTGNSTVYLGGASENPSCLLGAMSEVRWESVARTAQWLEASAELQSERLPGIADIEIGFPEYTGSGTLTNFPALVALDAGNTGFDAQAETALKFGAMDFYDAEGHALESEAELEGIDAGMTRTWWVKVPRLAAGTKIYARARPSYLSNRSALPAVNTNIWGDAVGVWHFSAREPRADSTVTWNMQSGFSDAGVMVGTNVNAAVDGPTGRYGAMQTGTSTVTKGLMMPTVASLNLTNVFTVSFWARKEDLVNPKQAYMFVALAGGQQSALITSFWDSDNYNKYFFFQTATAYAYGGSEAGRTSLSAPDREWHHYAFVCDGTALSGYQDGEVVFSGQKPYNFCLSPETASVDPSTKVTLYFGSSSKAANGFLGAFDEFRIERVARTADWIRMMYANQEILSKGTERFLRPAFAADATGATRGADAVGFMATLSCKQASEVTFCWGTTDGGEELGAWENRRVRGSCAGGALPEQLVEGLAEDSRVVARFCASNAAGAAWSPLLCARTPMSRHMARATISFADAFGGETLTNFPVCVRLPTSCKLPATANGLRFADAAGTPLAYEVESWNPSGDSVVWVRVPRLNAETSVTAMWRQNGDGDAWVGPQVWDDTYVRVLHFGDADVDSSRCAATCIARTSGTNDAGRVGRGLGYSGVTGVRRYSAVSFNQFSDGFTISFWAKIERTEQTYLMASVRGDTFHGQAWECQNSIIYGFSGDLIELFLRYVSPFGSSVTQSDQFREVSGIPRGDDDWHHYAWSYDGRTLTKWKDGACLARTGVSGTLGSYKPVIRDADVVLGGTSSGGSLLKGALDEFRIESAPRSDAWMRAVYANEAGTLVRMGNAVQPGTMLILR